MFLCTRKPVTLINPVYRKDEKYYPEVFLEKFIHITFFGELSEVLVFGAWETIFKRYKKYLEVFIRSLGLRHFYGVDFFTFRAQKVFLKKFHFPKYKKSFFEKI